ncbi:hypothetical protein FD755_013522 [Muntiacus reevesi]|uniref:Uncharacterized protein n=1 Tax=Muntiacus reevesi TaxID=9886 RepID=A0A5N3XNX6_MUNRE|nr:hypothetical protein FD755_013522 [Muntiacus reevesi]
MEMMLDKKQIQVIFLFEFKMGCKAVETTCNVNSAFGSGTPNEHSRSGGSRNEEHSGWPSEVDSDQLRAIIEANPLTTTPEHLKQIGKVMNLVLSSLILCNNSELFLNQIVTCDEKWILHGNQ